MNKLKIHSIRIDDIPMRMEVADLDRDGITGEIETVRQRLPIQGQTEIIQPTEMGEALKHLNEDTLEMDSMTSIDMRGRLHHAEISSVLALDALVSLNVCPRAFLLFTRRKKRLSASIDGKGREEITTIGVARQENKNISAMQKMGQFFTGKQQ